MAEVKRIVINKGKRTVYVAKCAACGWAGPERTAFDAAADDAVAHDVTENDE